MEEKFAGKIMTDIYFPIMQVLISPNMKPNIHYIMSIRRVHDLVAPIACFKQAWSYSFHFHCIISVSGHDLSFQLEFKQACCAGILPHYSLSRFHSIMKQTSFMILLLHWNSQASLLCRCPSRTVLYSTFILSWSKSRSWLCCFNRNSQASLLCECLSRTILYSASIILIVFP